MTPTEKRLFVSNFKKNECMDIYRKHKKDSKWDWFWVSIGFCLWFVAWVMLCSICG